MSLSKREKLTILFDQIQLDDSDRETYYKDSLLEKVIVHKREKRWDFHMSIDKSLPFNQYYTLINALQTHFEPIANIKLMLHMEAETCQLEAEDLNKYWAYFVKTNDEGKKLL